jgi:hypothetical protein
MYIMFKLLIHKIINKFNKMTVRIINNKIHKISKLIKII